MQGRKKNSSKRMKIYRGDVVTEKYTERTNKKAWLKGSERGSARAAHAEMQRRRNILINERAMKRYRGAEIKYWSNFARLGK